MSVLVPTAGFQVESKKHKACKSLPGQHLPALLFTGFGFFLAELPVPGMLDFAVC